MSDACLVTTVIHVQCLIGVVRDTHACQMQAFPPLSLVKQSKIHEILALTGSDWGGTRRVWPPDLPPHSSPAEALCTRVLPRATTEGSCSQASSTAGAF